MITRLRKWIHLLAFTGMAQVAVQAIGFVSGILIVRLLPLHEYALYTLANSLLGAMTILADGGVANGVMAEGGKVWQDKRKLGGVLATGFLLRRKQVVFSLLVVVPALFYMLQKHNASWLMSALVVLSLIPVFISTLSGALLQIPLKLHQDIKPLQQYQVEANLVRLGLSALTVFIYPFASLAILCSGTGQFWNNWRLRKRSAQYTENVIKNDPATHQAILAMTRRAMPLAIFYIITGQASIWLLTMFATTESVAHQGAISRFAAVLMLTSTIYSVLITPRFSRLSRDNSQLLSIYIGIHFSLLLVLAATLFFSWSLGGVALSILGPEYEELRPEFFLAMTGAMLSIMTDIGSGVNSGRGYVFRPVAYIPLMLLLLAILIFVFPTNTLMGVLLINLIYRSATCLLTFAYGAYRLRNDPGVPIA
ncbi:MAG: hypothetical protein Q7T97_10650 [Burkholderiaceae bacterium]|nr:hypothetical protein [Burkholderiaceae bacterium]